MEASVGANIEEPVEVAETVADTEKSVADLEEVAEEVAEEEKALEFNFLPIAVGMYE